MKGRNKIIISTLILIFIILLSIAGYFIYKEKTSNADKIKEQFIAKLKESDNISREKLLDYRVDEVKILSESEKQALNEKEEYSPKDVLAFVKYSVKPKNIEDTVWIAGNGEIDGEWIINKTACECLRNGKLVKSSGFSTGF
jgi:hypothetical protein